MFKQFAKRFAVVGIILFFSVGIILEVVEVVKLAVTVVSASAQSHYNQEKNHERSVQ